MIPFRYRPKFWIARIRTHEQIPSTSGSQLSKFSLCQILARISYPCTLRCVAFVLRSVPCVPVRPVASVAAWAAASVAVACGKQAKRKQAAKSIFFAAACGLWRFVSPVACGIGGGGGIGGGLWPLPLPVRPLFMWWRPVPLAFRLWRWPVWRRWRFATFSPLFPVPFSLRPKLHYYREKERNAARRRRSLWRPLCCGGLCLCCGLCGLCGGGGVLFCGGLCCGLCGLCGLCLFACGLCLCCGGLCLFLCFEKRI